MITLTSAVLEDISGVRTWTDFATHLNAIHRRSGLRYSALQRYVSVQGKDDSRPRDLPNAVSDALNGTRPIKRDLLESLLAAWQVPAQEHDRVVDAWQRLHATLGRGPANAGRFDEASPRELGVHPAISGGAASSDLPGYVRRDFDDLLQDMLAGGVDRGCFVVLMGGSSCGKTRSLYEAVRNVVPDWWLVQPTRTQDILDLSTTPAERTVLWLDELHRYLGADPPLRRTDIAALVRAGTIVVGTLWPIDYFSYIRLGPVDAGDIHAEDRRLLKFAELVTVSETLTVDERERALALAATDSRIEAALTVSDAGLTQVLAAGPDLVNSWEHAPNPYSKAIITAAADARRLGVHSPLPAQLLTEAMVGYLSPADRVALPETWLEQALPHATSRLHGAVSPLTAVAVARAGNLEGYVVADYLTQHIGRVRRVESPPEQLWTALADHIHDRDDLRRLASTALMRLRYTSAEQALRTLHLAGDMSAAGELVTLFRRQDRLEDAAALVDDWVATDPRAGRSRVVRAELVRARARAEQLRRRAADDPSAVELLAELLADGGQADALRARATAGDVVAAEDLAELLADRGCVDELRHRADAGHSYAADRLADLLASLGRTDELQRRVDAGDPAAALYLARLQKREEQPRPGGELARLRADADSGNEDAATELTGLLFDTRDRSALLAEVNAGTYLAAERYLALLTADPAVDRGQLRRLRAFGLTADGIPGGTGTAT